MSGHIEAQGLTKRYSGGTLAVDNLSVHVEAGETYCLLGGLGSGKTTALEMIGGLTTPSAGRVFVDNIDAAQDGIGVRQRLTFVTAAAALYGSMTARENLAFFASLGRSAKRADPDECVNAMRSVGLPERVFDHPLKAAPRHVVISVWLAIALVRRASVVALDEPTKGLDSRLVEHVLSAMSVLRERLITSVVSTEDASFAGRTRGRIGILRTGRLVAERTGAQLLQFSVDELSALPLTTGPQTSPQRIP